MKIEEECLTQDGKLDWKLFSFLYVKPTLYVLHLKSSFNKSVNTVRYVCRLDTKLKEDEFKVGKTKNSNKYKVL